MEEDHYADACIIKELGANTIRLAHYQHSQEFYDACDEFGFAVWAEIPFISVMSKNPKAHENCINQMKELVEEEEALLHSPLTAEALIQAKKDGFSDHYLAEILDVKQDDIRNAREALGCTENWEGVHVSGTQDSAYYYSTYIGEDKNPINTDRPKIMILGGGPNRIGQGIEFDYCCVHAAQSLRKLGFETMTSFAIFLGKDYYDRFGEHFDIATYSKALGPVIDK